jgi:hypothetical protein
MWHSNHCQRKTHLQCKSTALLVVSQDETGEESSETYPGMMEQWGVALVKGRFPRATPFPIGWSTTSFLHDCEGFLRQRPAGDLDRMSRTNFLAP